MEMQQMNSAQHRFDQALVILFVILGMQWFQWWFVLLGVTVFIVSVERLNALRWEEEIYEW
jgi:hypothetical protein